MHQRHRYPCAQGKLSNSLGKAMAPDLGVEGDDGMWGQADKRSKQGKKQPQHEERAAGLASLQKWHHVTAATDSCWVACPPS